MMRVPFALALVLMLLTTAWGQPHDQSASRWFRVSWEPSKHSVAPRIEGQVYNNSPYRVTAVRVLVQGVDADSHLVGQTLVWALGDIDPDGETSFVVEAMPGAVSYRIAVDTFDVVSVGRAP